MAPICVDDQLHRLRWNRCQPRSDHLPNKRASLTHEIHGNRVTDGVLLGYGVRHITAAFTFPLGRPSWGVMSMASSFGPRRPVKLPGGRIQGVVVTPEVNWRLVKHVDALLGVPVEGFAWPGVEFLGDMF